MTAVANDLDIRLDDFDDDGIEIGAGEQDDGWDQQETTLTAARTIYRHLRLVPPGTKMKFRASFTDGAWRGPEAQHVLDLMSQGVIAEASGAVQTRNRRQAAMDEERGVHEIQTERNSEGTVIDRYQLKSLGEPDYERTKALLRPMIGDPKAVRARDRAERRAAVKDLAEAFRDAGLVPDGSQAPRRR